MSKVQSEGICQLCQGVFKKGQMTRHIQKCVATHEREGQAVSQSRVKTGRLFHVIVQSPGASEYWLHLEVPETATLLDLDVFLRRIWLECCGHMSQFKIGHTYYLDSPEYTDFDSPWGMDSEEKEMTTSVADLFHPKLEFSYEYDMGSTTELALKVAGERQGPVTKKSGIRLMARNIPPIISCGKCGAPAAWIDTEHSWEAEGWLCEKCAGEDPEMFLPVVNSPRTGVCGYTG